jgi:hypothetical protein
MTEEKRNKGAWILHHTNKLQGVSSQTDFNNIFTAGKSGLLLSAISASDDQEIDKIRLRTLAAAENINSLELPEILRRLKDGGLVNVADEKVKVLGVTNYSVLQHTAAIFEGLEPSREEEAVLFLAEKVSISPLSRQLYT